MSADPEAPPRAPALNELALLASILAVLGTVGVARAQNVARDARANEAVDKLAYLFRMSAVYFTTERPTPAGAEPLEPSFPGSAGPTPALARIGARPVTNPSIEWEQPTWEALSFSVSDPHFYAYTYRSSGKGHDAGFTARANGDLDGDRVYSTFERTGRVNPQLELVGSRALTIVNENE